MSNYFATAALLCVMSAPLAAESEVKNAEDPYLWLEEVTSDKALSWVRERNAQTQQELEGGPGFDELRRDLLAILDSDDKIPFVGKQGEHYYNFWKDKQHERGVWRRTTLPEYRKAEPEWELLLDVDALNAKEGENWVWQGADCLKPAYRRCLLALSRGGADANVTREFDLVDKAFVESGFERPEAKGGLQWIDADRVYVFTDFGAGSMTSSGYPRVVKEWRRGTPLATAKTVFEGKPDDLYISATRDLTTGFERDFVSRAVAFYAEELLFRDQSGKLIALDLPISANKSVQKEWLLMELRDPFKAGKSEWPAGALIAARFDDFIRGRARWRTLFMPSPTTSLAGTSWTRDFLLMNVLDDVKNRIYAVSPDKTEWKRETLAGTPAIGTLSVSAVDDEESNAYFLTVADYLTPTTLLWGEVGKPPEKLKQTPSFFSIDGLVLSQHFTVSKDGTRVPYFMVARDDLKRDGRNATLLYGYGGFEVSMLPSYAPGVGRGWLQYGGVYVVANIRGGGEYGPRWHQAALKENRLRAYEDFAAVAEDLFRNGVTTAERLGIQGGSNGGLLVGNMFTLYPQLFGAAVCQVPLLDMRRYHKLLAGASWMAEYGDPDQPEEWAFIQKFSPYHNVRAEVQYPKVLFTTSTRDDRVHPGHARKMMARMTAQGHLVWYYENIEGGHGGAADNKQLAFMQALSWTFLRKNLM